MAEVRGNPQELRSVPLPISAQIPLRVLIRPFVVAVLATLLASSQSIRTLEPPYSIFFPIISGALIYIVLSVFRLMVRSWMVKTWLGVALATGVVLVAVAVVINIELALKLQLPDPLWLAALLSIGFAGFLSAVYTVITERRSLTEQQLRAAILEEQNILSLLRQNEFLVRSHLGYLIHGTVQSALTAAAMRLASQAEPDEQSIAEVRRSISRAVAKIDVPNDSYILLIDTLNDIAEIWTGFCEVNWTLGYRTVRILVESPLAAVSVAAISRESVGNAIRHGSATNVWITISEDGESMTSDSQPRDRIMVSVRDDGHGMDPNWKPGLGTQMFDELCLEWNRLSDLSGTHLNASIATGLN
jgi:signal transduction histidine kinase